MSVDVVRRMGVIAGSAPLEGRALALPALRGADGAVRAGVVAALADSIAGVHAFEIEPEALPLTADLAVHLTGRGVEEGRELAATSVVLKRRRTGAVFQVEVTPSGAPGVLLATATVTYSYVSGQSPYQPEPLQGPWPPADLADDVDALLPLPAAADGALELAIDAVTCNAVGVLAGGVIVLALDQAAVRRGAEVLGGPVATSDLAVHFLAPGRQGPARLTTDVVARTGGRASLRHRLHEGGDAGRLLAVASAAVVPAPAREEAA